MVMKPAQHIEASSGLDEARRTLVREAMRDPLWKGVERGVYEIKLDLPVAGPGLAAVDVLLEDAVLLRQVGRLLQRVVDENQEALRAVAGSAEPRRLLGAAWAALEPVRCVGYADGGYQVKLHEGRVVTYYVTEWDGALLRRHDALLGRVYAEHREAVDRAAALAARALGPLEEAA
jgi:hypothetical protein